MTDELDNSINDTLAGDDIPADLNDDDKEIADIDPSEISIDEPDADELSEDPVVSPEEDPFGFGAFGELDEDGDYVAPKTDDEDETEDEISEDLF